MTHEQAPWIDGDDLLKEPRFAAEYEDARELTALIRRLTALRKRSSLTQLEVAERMGTTQSAVSDFENGEHDPQFSTIQRYARALGMRIHPDVIDRLPFEVTVHDLVTQIHVPTVGPSEWTQSVRFVTILGFANPFRIPQTIDTRGSETWKLER